MKTEKKTYEKPTVQKVEFDFKTRIAASTCLAVKDGVIDTSCTLAL